MVSDYPTSTNLSRVDGLSTDPRDLGCHTPKLKFLLVLKKRKERSCLSPSNGRENIISPFLFNQNRVIKLAKGYVICVSRIILTKNIENMIKIIY